MVNRERWTRLSELETTLLAKGLFAGGKGEEVQNAVAALTKEFKGRLFHQGFSARRLAARLKGELAEIRANQLRLKKLDAMTV
jgi:hypothetical protein